MGKIQSRVGSTLTSVYDIRGGVAGLEELRTQEVGLVHDMAPTIQSERFSSTIRRRTTGDLAQGVVWDELITDLPAGVSRILGVQVFVDTAARSDRVAVMVRDPVAGREFPIFIWNSTTGIFENVRMVDNDGAPASFPFLIPVEPKLFLPSLLVGSDQPQAVPDIAFRGQTPAFGAGTVSHTLIIHLAFAAIGGLSSRGLPVPSW